jgi:hypothetical protein
LSAWGEVITIIQSFNLILYASKFPLRRKAEVLRGRVIEKLQEMEAEKRPSPKRPPAPERPLPERQRPSTPRSPKTLFDQKAFLRAINTPLPASTSPRRREKSIPAATPVMPTRHENKPFSIVRLLIVFLLIALASGAVYTRCQGQYVDCIGVCRKYATDVQSLITLHTQQGLDYLQSKATAAHGHISKRGNELLFRCKNSITHGIEALKRLLHSVQKALPSRSVAILGGGGGQESREDKKRYEFDGSLNKAVLQSVLGQRRSEEWDQLNLQVANLWQGERVSNNKANTILFACESQSACQHLEEELAAAAPVESTLILSSGDVAAGKGELQARLSHFLKAQPRGVVLIPNIDKAPFSSLSVLCAAMGEYGAFELDGSNVSATGATFLLTWLAPPAIAQEDSAYSFTTAAKKELVLLLLKSATHALGSSNQPDGMEDARAQVHAFRRRIDVVVLSESIA